MFDRPAGLNPERGANAPLPVGVESATVLASVDGGSAGLGELLDLLAVAQRHASWLESVQLRVLAAIAERDRVVQAAEQETLAAANAAVAMAPEAPAWAVERDRHWICEEVALICRCGSGTALSRLHDAEQLVSRLPETVAKLATGDLLAVQARRLSEATASLTDAQCTAIQARVLARAATMSVSGFCRLLRRAVLAAAPKTAEQAHVEAVADRRVVTAPDEHGMGTLWALLSAPDLLAVQALIRDRAHCYLTYNPNDPRTADQRRADALVDLIHLGAAVTRNTTAGAARDTASAGPVTTGPVTAGPVTTGPVTAGPATSDTGGGGSSPAGAATPARTGRGGPVIQVTVSLATLIGASEEPAELSRYGPISASMARQLAADPTGTWRRLVTDPAGQLVDFGRTRYRPPKSLDDHVRARDQHCGFPNCYRSATTSELDHIRAWADGGTTNANNLIALCPRHHHAKHEGGWTVQRDRSTGATIWTSPTGHKYANPPPHLPGAGQ
jgi:Domain of unknown function (DUF222)/HNH endonuclease